RLHRRGRRLHRHHQPHPGRRRGRDRIRLRDARPRRRLRARRGRAPAGPVPSRRRPDRQGRGAVVSERLAAVPPRGIPTVEFTVAGTRRLRRLGLAGRRLGAVAGPHALELRGDDGAPLVIPHAEIERLRVGKGESETGAYFETRLWRRSEPAPLILRAPRDQWYPY